MVLVGIITIVGFEGLLKLSEEVGFGCANTNNPNLQ